MHSASGAADLRVGLLPTLPFHAGVSMQAYAAGLMESLAEVPGIRAELLVPPFASGARPPWARSRWMRYVTYPAWAATQGADVYHVVDHGNAQLLLSLPRRRTVVTCHDLYPLVVATGRLRFPGVPRRIRMLPTALRLLALRRARIIFTVSQHTAEECRRLLGIPRSRLRVVHECISRAFWTPSAASDVAATRAALGVGAEDVVVLHVGSNDPRKNLGGVLDVVARLRSAGARPAWLVKVGAPFDSAMLARLRRAGLPPDAVRHAGRVNDAELIRLYHAATVLLYPSFHEGFCRPVVEAMATGLPVVASTAGAIPEVTRGAAILVSPTDADGMALRIAELAEDPARRRAMGDAGRERSRRFNSAAHGHALRDAYREVAG